MADHYNRKTDQGTDVSNQSGYDETIQPVPSLSIESNGTTPAGNSLDGADDPWLAASHKQPPEPSSRDDSPGHLEKSLSTEIRIESNCSPDDAYSGVSGHDNLEDDSEVFCSGELAKELENAFEGPEGSDKFIPADSLHRIVSFSRVKYELGRIPETEMSPEQLSQHAHMIVPQPPDETKRSRQKIFAILALLDQSKLKFIYDFIKEDIHDGDLPFRFQRQKQNRMARRKKDGQYEEIQFCKVDREWQTHLHESFYRNQWRLLAPHLELSMKSDSEVRHRTLERDEILPIVESDESQLEMRGGGYGTKNGDKHECFAVKELHRNGQLDLDKEATPLKRLGFHDHPHIVRLLLTYTQNNRHYLVFPWASGGNLVDLWKRYRSTPMPGDSRLGRWMAKQILGISKGLKKIHNCTADKSGHKRPSHGDENKIFGRHGDIKPANILCFERDSEDNDDSLLGVLKLSDFGLTIFHGAQSKSVDSPRNTACTFTYRAPEYELTDWLSQSYDVWTLGCVLLEFVTWYILGYKGVETFIQSRVEDEDRHSYHPVDEIGRDGFFMVYPQGRPWAKRVQEKESVCKHFWDLRQSYHCTDFSNDLLDLIQHRLLRVNLQNRSNMSEIVERLESIYAKCVVDDDYCSKMSAPRPTRSKTNLSELGAEQIEHIEWSRHPNSKLPNSKRQKSNLGQVPTIQE
ncbi:kinase-like domain-containing protein [Biscogniauxia mediterranea]|nr:kinase-like domain-containing protein [Biscogniauxia mediterranea]